MDRWKDIRISCIYTGSDGNEVGASKPYLSIWELYTMRHRVADAKVYMDAYFVVRIEADASVRS